MKRVALLALVWLCVAGASCGARDICGDAIDAGCGDVCHAPCPDAGTP